MNITNITDYDNDTDIIIQALKLSISLVVYTLVKPLINK